VCFGQFEEAVLHAIRDLGLVDRQYMAVGGELVLVEIPVCSGVLCRGIFAKSILAYTDATLVLEEN